MSMLNVIINSTKWLPTNKVAARLLSSQVKSTNHYDMVIVGGGMVGKTLACTLGKNPMLSDRKILLLEGSNEKSYILPEKYSNRVSSLNTGTINLLEQIGAWQIIQKARYGKVKRMQVWDGISDAMISFKPDDLSENLAYIVENDLLISAVSTLIKEMNNVKVHFQAKIKNYHLPEYSEDLVEITLENGTKFTCNLLLGCDGANSSVRSAMNVHYLNWSYKQMGVVATIKLDEKVDNCIAWQRFLPNGPVALLPLSDNLSSLVWSTTPQHAKELINMTNDEFMIALNKAIWENNPKSSIIDEVTKNFDNLVRYFNFASDRERLLPPKLTGCEDGSRAAFPLGFGHSTSYIGKGAVLLGDAAHRVHPLAGQGVNLGFGDISCLNNVLGKAIHDGSKLENLSYLKEYETERQKHNVPTMLAIEGLHRLYTSEFTPLVLLRSIGLQATHSINPLKKAIMSHAQL